MIEISDLTFSYPGTDTESEPFPILDQINLTISEGESIGMMGANGSGKTTFARCLNGLLQPTAGAVRVDRMDTAEPENLIEIRRLVGLVFQNPENQIVSTTVESEIAFGLENLGMPHEKMHSVVDEMLEKFDLTRYRTHPPHLLSGGEMQRLALAAVMAMSPQYVIFDEPTSLLDFPARSRVLSLVEEIHKHENSTTTLLISQYPEEVLSFDRLLILHNGKILFDAPPQQVFEEVDALRKIGLKVPLEFEVNRHLKNLSNGRLALNPSDFLPIP